MRLEITPLTQADLPEVLEIERESHLEPWTEELFMDELRRLHSRVLAVRIPWVELPGEERGKRGGSFGRLVAYICFWRIADEIQVLNIAVHKNFRRKGVGKFLLSNVLRFGWEQRARLAVLEVRRSNLAARRLYESLGFHQVGERPNYYGVLKEPAVLMQLEFDREAAPRLSCGTIETEPLPVSLRRTS